MLKRPQGIDREIWRSERNSVWRRRNRMLNLLMIAAIVAVLVRYFST